MIRSTLLIIALVLSAIVAPHRLPAQATEGATGNHIRLTIPAPNPYEGVPFKVESPSQDSPDFIEIRAASQMTKQDRNLAADAEATIRERAGFESLGFNEGIWTYQQLVCPVFPNHLLLRFQRNNGTSDVSMFSASIPRSGEGRVRIIPILRRSYSMWSPAPISAMTISAFNHIGGEEQLSADKPDWVATGLCYAALAGANPRVASVARYQDQKFPAIMPPTLEVQASGGGATVHLVNVDARPMEWAMSFDRNGKLIKATHSTPSVVTAHGMLPQMQAPRGKPLPDTLTELHGKPVR
jgi:hypothetical protein